MDIEFRNATTDDFELREAGGRPRLSGYAAVFDRRSLDLGGVVEVIRRGAFARTLKSDPDVRAYVEHSPAQIIGRRPAGTLELVEDARVSRSRSRRPIPRRAATW